MLYEAAEDLQVTGEEILGKNLKDLATALGV